MSHYMRSDGGRCLIACVAAAMMAPLAGCYTTTLHSGATAAAAPATRSSTTTNGTTVWCGASPR